MEKDYPLAGQVAVVTGAGRVLALRSRKRYRASAPRPYFADVLAPPLNRQRRPLLRLGEGPRWFPAT